MVYAGRKFDTRFKEVPMWTTKFKNVHVALFVFLVYLDLI